MEKPKKIIIDYSGSWINTTKIFAFLFLISGTITSVALFFGTDRHDRDEIIVPVLSILIGGIIMFLAGMIISKILQHLLYVRRFFENKATVDGYEFEVINSDL